MYFPLVFQVISCSCSISHLPHPLLCILFYMYVRIGQLLVFILSAVSWVPFTLAVPYSLFIFLLYAPPPPPHPPFTTGFVIAFIFQAVETLLATSSAVSNAANLDTGLRTVDPCPGPEVTSPLATILSLGSPTTSQPQANQLNQSNEDVLAQVDQFTQNYETWKRTFITC